jgi:tetratricopeptide (TPR) repeat protein
MRARPIRLDGPTDVASIKATVEAGLAAVRAGAIEAGVQSLRTGVAMADAGSRDLLRVTSRIALSEALIHSLRGQDEEGVAALHIAEQVGLAIHELGLAADAQAEIGYVDFLRARYDRAELWLTQARALGERPDSPATVAKTGMYLGAIASDRGNYPEAVAHLEEALRAARAAGEIRMEAFALSMYGRVHLIRRNLDAAAHFLDQSLELSERSHWLAFLPWPQALRGEVELGRSNPATASGLLDQAFARACQLGDPCWEGIAARGLALAAEAAGDSERAFDILADARIRSNRLADPYVWLEAHILDAQCSLGRSHAHPDTDSWVRLLESLASRTGMKEFTVRSLLHSEALGNPSAGRAARILGAEIDNPALTELLHV